jgi:hypothetical protein
LTYFLEYFRSFYGFDGAVKGLLGWGFGLTGFYLIVEGFLFKGVLYRARKNGILIKLSE